MAFVPELPGIAPVSYGQGYGNWQKYTGFNAQNPFGSMPQQTSTQTPVAPPTKVPVIDAVPTMTSAPTGQFGTQPQGSFGSDSGGQFGTIEDALKADELLF
jgi:hypothetical protein